MTAADSGSAVLTLVTGDIPALNTLAAIQGDVAAQPLTRQHLTDLMSQLNVLSYTTYAGASSAIVKSWLDLLYSSLIAQKTCYGQTLPGLFIAYNYGLYVAGDYEAWYEISGETYLNFMGLNAPNIPRWSPPPQSPTWSSTVSSLAQSWNSSGPPASVIASRPGMGYQDEINFQANLFDPANWQDASTVVTGLTPLWTAQSQQLQTMQKSASLQANDAVLLLYLLIAGVNSPNANDRTLAGRIAALDASSPESPNDTFADQLAYFWLMTMVDPLGGFAFQYKDLTAFVSLLAGAVGNADPGSQLLAQVLNRQGRILAADQSYPMQDPYNPATGFSVRQTDTLAALNRAWAAFNGSGVASATTN